MSHPLGQAPLPREVGADSPPEPKTTTTSEECSGFQIHFLTALVNLWGPNVTYVVEEIWYARQVWGGGGRVRGGAVTAPPGSPIGQPAMDWVGNLGIGQPAMEWLALSEAWCASEDHWHE